MVYTRTSLVLLLGKFGFRNEHGTIDQVNEIINVLKEGLEEKNKMCTAVFLDVAQECKLKSLSSY